MLYQVVKTFVGINDDMGRRTATGRAAVNRCKLVRKRGDAREKFMVKYLSFGREKPNNKLGLCSSVALPSFLCFGCNRHAKQEGEGKTTSDVMKSWVGKGEVRSSHGSIC